VNRPSSGLESSATRGSLGWTILRVVLALLIAAHGWVRFVGGGVAPFGEWLTSQGLPAGFALAAAITALEIIGTVALALGRLVVPLCLLFSLVYAVGIAMVHAPEGWFVVGRGRNGAEYSVLLIVALLCVALAHWRGGARR